MADQGGVAADTPSDDAELVMCGLETNPPPLPICSHCKPQGHSLSPYVMVL